MISHLPKYQFSNIIWLTIVSWPDSGISAKTWKWCAPRSAYSHFIHSLMTPLYLLRCSMVLPVTLYLTRITYLHFVHVLTELSKTDDTSQENIEDSHSLTDTSAPCIYTHVHTVLEVYTIRNNLGTSPILHVWCQMMTLVWICHSYMAHLMLQIDWIISVTRGQRLNHVTSLMYRSQPVWTRWDYGRFYEFFCNFSTKTT